MNISKITQLLASKGRVVVVLGDGAYTVNGKETSMRKLVFEAKMVSNQQRKSRAKEKHAPESVEINSGEHYTKNRGSNDA